MGQPPATRENAKMAKLKIEQRADGSLAWSDRASGNVFWTFRPEDVAPALRDAVFAYGVKQILSDAMAGKSGRDADDAFAARAESLREGTWGQRRSGLPDQLTFQALVALGLLPDTDDIRARWRERKPAERAALGRRPDVAQWIVDNATDDAGDSILDDLLGGE